MSRTDPLPITEFFEPHLRILAVVESLGASRAFSSIEGQSYVHTVVSRGRPSRRLLSELRELAGEFDIVVIATDPDPWGELFALEILRAVEGSGADIARCYPIAACPALILCIDDDSWLSGAEERAEEAEKLEELRDVLEPEAGTLLALAQLVSRSVEGTRSGATTLWLAARTGARLSTLKTLEELYLRGLLTYPRTRSRDIPPPVAEFSGFPPTKGWSHGKTALLPRKDLAHPLATELRKLAREMLRGGKEPRSLLEEAASRLEAAEIYIGFRSCIKAMRLWRGERLGIDPPAKWMRISELIKLCKDVKHILTKSTA